RARAIETACHVVAAAQAGTHADGRATFGHSLAIGPWGDVLGESALADRAAQADFGLVLAPIDPAATERARQAIPLETSRRIRNAPL
ncbi:nitrilase-related carbon-nitrogen hydrolase, partial [Salmonella enterica]|uniref:nitrilase-related carbon-nitrogen hydrolase n=1 Tax=Salmonella enterica TaxID=28901 RepID=UPI0026653EEE